MTRQYKPFTDSDEQLKRECFDRIETDADRELVNFWVEKLNDANNHGQHIPAMQARQHLRIFKEKRGKKCSGH